MASSDFDDFDDFDKMFDEIDGDVFTSSKKRKPISYFKEGFLTGLKDTLKDKALDDYSRKEIFKEAGLKGVGNTLSILQKGVKEANNLYNEANEQLKNPLKGLVKELDSRIPENKTFLKKLSAKAKSILGVDEDSEYQSKSSEQLEQEGIQNTLEETFGKNTLMTEAANNARFQAQFKQSGLGNKLLSNANLGIQSLVKYQNTIDVNYKKKSLELQLKSLIVQKRQLDVVTQMLGSIINQNKAIQLNTSLPDQDKIMHSKHANKHLLTKNILKHSYNLFNSSEYINRLKTNLRNKVKEHIENASSGIEAVNSGLEMTRDMGLNPFMMLGMGAAGLLPIDTVMQSVVAPWLKKKIKPGSKISNINKTLQKYTTDIEGGGNALLDKLRSKFRVDSEERFGGNGLKTALKDLVYDTLGGMKTSKTDWFLDKKDNGSNLFNPVPFNLQTQKSINLVIPGYLARILQQVTQNNLNNPGLGTAKVPLLSFSHDKNKFTDNKRMVGQASLKMNQALQTKYSRKYISDIVDKNFQGQNLNDKQKQLLRTHITKGMFNGVLGDRDYLLNDEFHKNLSAEDSLAIKNAVGRSLNTDDSNLKFLSQFAYAKTQIGDPRALVEKMINEGREEDLIKAGYIRRTRFGYKINQDKIIDQLSKGKGVDRVVKPDTVMGNVIKATNTALNNTTKNLYTQAAAKADPYVQRAQSIVEPYARAIGGHVQNKVSDVISSLPKKYNDEVKKLEQLYAEYASSPNNQKVINRYNSSVVSFKGRLDKLRKQYKNSPNILSSIDKIDSYFKPIQSPIQGSQSEGGFIRLGMPSVTEDSIIGRAKRFFNRKSNNTTSALPNPEVDLSSPVYSKENTFTENTNTGQVESKGPKKHKEENVMSILTKFYNKFKDFSDSIVDVHVVSEDTYENIKKDGDYKKVRKRRGILGRTLDKVTRPFAGVGSKVKGMLYDTPLSKLQALKTLFPTETVKKLLKLPFTAGGMAYGGIKTGLEAVKKVTGWINPLNIVKGAATRAYHLARTGSSLINNIGCYAEDLYKVKDKDGSLSAEPILTKWGFVNGEYFNANGKVIHTTCDIKGNIYDSNQNVIVTEQYIKEYGLFNKHGKKINTKGFFGRVVGRVARELWNIPSTIAKHAGKMLSLPGKALGYLAKHGTDLLGHVFSGFGFAGGLAKSGMNLMSSILKPFGHIGKLFRDPYTEKSYKVLIDIRKLLINKLNGGSWHGYNQKLSTVNGKIVPGVRTELDDPTAQVFADRWWKHPGQSIKNKLGSFKNKIYNPFIKSNNKSSHKKSSGGLLGDLGSDAMDALGGFSALKFAKSKLGNMVKWGKNKIGGIWNWAKAKLGLGGDAAGDAAGDVAGDAVADVAGGAAADAGVAGGLEAAGAGLDATGVGAPIGVILNVAGGLALLYGLFHKQINQAVSWGWNKLEKGIGWIEKKVGDAASWAAKKLGIDTAVKAIGNAYTDTKDALEDKHHKGYYTKLDHSKKAPLGIKLNNPLYIKYWPVEPNLPKVNGYVKIATAETGLYISAAYIKYYISKGYDTIPKLIVKMDLPGIQKDPKNFILRIANQARISIKTKLNMNDAEVLDRVLTSIILIQNGALYYSPALISQVAKDMAKAKPLDITATKASIPPSIQKALPKKTVKPIKPATVASKIAKSHSKAQVGKSSLSFGQTIEKGIVGMLTGALAGIFGLSSSIFKGIGEAAVSAYNGVKYVGGKIAHYTLKGFKDLEGDFASVVKLVSFYGLSGLTAFLESRGNPAAVSTGVGDHGGVSYGTFQLSSLTGGVQGFLGYIQNTTLGKKLINSGAVDSQSFINMWKKLATTEPKFNHMQAEYNKVNYYDPIMHQLAQSGCDLSDKKLGVQCVLDRTSNQFGPGGGANLVLTALHGKDVSKLSSDDVIKLIEDHKLNNINSFFSGCSPSERQGVARELLMEKKFGIKLNGATVKISSKAVNKAPPKTKKVTNVKGKVNQKAVNKKLNNKPTKPADKKPETSSKALTTTSTKQPIAKIHTGFTGPAKTTPVTHPVVMTTNHQDVKDIHSHVADMHTLLQKSVEIQTKIYDELKKTNTNTETKSKNYNSELEAEQSVLGNPRNASPGNKNRKPTNVPKPVVNISRYSLENKVNSDW